MRRIADVPGIRWVRLFYLYPEKLDDELIELLADHPRGRAVRRHAAAARRATACCGACGAVTAAARLRALVERLRKRVPDLVFRTAFIVGHPGETDAEFEELCDFVRWAEFDRVGVFRYSDEPSARAHGLPDKVAAQGRRRARPQASSSIQRQISQTEEPRADRPRARGARSRARAKRASS